MPVQMNFIDEEKKVILAEYIGKWTWDEFFPARAQINSEINEVDHPVYIIHNWAKQTSLPNNILSNTKRLIEKQQHQHAKLHVFVGANELFMTMWRMFLQLYVLPWKFSFVFANNFDEALELVKRKREEVEAQEDTSASVR